MKKDSPIVPPSPRRAKKAQEAEITHNAIDGLSECAIERLYFDLNRISLWVDREASVDIAEAIVNYRGPVSCMDYSVAKRIVSKLHERIKTGGHSKEIGWLMQMHQLVLAEAGFVESQYQQLLAWINGLPMVLGAKSSCARGRGAILLFTREPIEPSSDIYHKLIDRGLWPVSLMNSFGKGIIASREW
jgi:hypothetical protein